MSIQLTSIALIMDRKRVSRRVLFNQTPNGEMKEMAPRRFHTNTRRRNSRVSGKKSCRESETMLVVFAVSRVNYEGRSSATA